MTGSRVGLALGGWFTRPPSNPPTRPPTTLTTLDTTNVTPDNRFGDVDVVLTGAANDNVDIDGPDVLVDVPGAVEAAASSVGADSTRAWAGGSICWLVVWPSAWLPDRP